MKNVIWVVFLLIFGCAKEEVEEEIIRPVRYEEVAAREGDVTKMFSGTAKALMEVKMSFKVNGSLDKLDVDVGQKLDSGQVVARLDETDYRLQYEQAIASLYQAKAREKNASSNYERMRLLYENNNVALSEYESAEAQYESERANVRALSKQVELHRTQLSYCTLYAPFDGIVTAKEVEVNENVQAGQPIIELSSGKGIEVRIDVPDVYIPYVTKGDTVKVTFSALKNEKYEGKVTEVAYSIGQKRASYPVIIQLTENAPNIRPGMAASVVFAKQTGHKKKKNTIVIPAIAIGEDDSGKFVYTLESEGDSESGFWTANKRRVEVGDFYGDGVVVLSGIRQGDKVVTAGVSRLKDGMTVKSIH